MKSWLAERLDPVGGNYTLDVTVSGELFLVAARGDQRAARRGDPPGHRPHPRVQHHRRHLGRALHPRLLPGRRVRPRRADDAQGRRAGRNRRPRRVDRDLRRLSRPVLRPTLTGNAAWIEVQLAVGGACAWPAATGAGSGFFDRSLDGFWRSFRAAVICYPLYLVLLSHAGQRGGMEEIGRLADHRRRNDRLCDRLGGLSAVDAAGGALDRARAPFSRFHGRLQLVPDAAERAVRAGRARDRGRCAAPRVSEPIEIAAAIAVLVYEWYIARVALETTGLAAVLVVSSTWCSGRSSAGSPAGFTERRVADRYQGEAFGPVRSVRRRGGRGRRARARHRRGASARARPASGCRPCCAPDGAGTSGPAPRYGFPRRPAQVERVERLYRRLRLAQRIAEGREIVMPDQMAGALAHRLDIERRRDVPHPAAFERRRRPAVEDAVEITRPVAESRASKSSGAGSTARTLIAAGRR